MPPRPIRPKGQWLAGSAYVTGDIVRVEASATVARGLIAYATGAFTADATDPANDIASGALLPLAYDGKPAQTPRGTYDPGLAYVLGDVVQAANGAYYQLMRAAPAGTTPGQPLMANGSPVLENGNLVFPWAQLSVQTMSPFHFSTTGKPTAGQVLIRRMADRAGYFGPNQVGASAKLSSNAKAGTPATGTVTLTLAVNGTTVGTVVFAPGKLTPTYTTVNAQPVLLNVGDVVTLTAPATQDSGLADLIGYVALQ